MPKVTTIKPRIGLAKLGHISSISTQTHRITGRKLQSIRQRWLSAHPLCEHCQKNGRVTAATEVDHVVPLHQGGPDDDRNRQSLCWACHHAKTAAEAAERSRGGAGQKFGTL